MFSRIIIKHDETISDLEALEYVNNIIKMGKISDDKSAYCSTVIFKSEIVVTSKKTKSGHSFDIQNYNLNVPDKN